MLLYEKMPPEWRHADEGGEPYSCECGYDGRWARIRTEAKASASYLSVIAPGDAVSKGQAGEADVNSRSITALDMQPTILAECQAEALVAAV